MSREAHTPGPWEYYPARNYDGFAIAPLGTLPTLAAVERGNPNTLNVTAFNFPGQTEANARLIAAAPALLEALKYVVRIHAKPDVAPENQPHEISVAMQTIHSATGEG